VQTQTGGQYMIRRLLQLAGRGAADEIFNEVTERTDAELIFKGAFALRTCSHRTRGVNGR